VAAKAAIGILQVVPAARAVVVVAIIKLAALRSRGTLVELVQCLVPMTGLPVAAVSLLPEVMQATAPLAVVALANQAALLALLSLMQVAEAVVAKVLVALVAPAVVAPAARAAAKLVRREQPIQAEEVAALAAALVLQVQAAPASWSCGMWKRPWKTSAATTPSAARSPSEAASRSARFRTP
jgi:hypothetical protein